jgi:hypothetical protein
MKKIVSYAFVFLLWSLSILAWAIWQFSIPFLVILVLHVIETITVGISTGIRYGKSIGESGAMCMIFGSAWWLPLRKQMKLETFTDADFLWKD